METTKDKKSSPKVNALLVRYNEAYTIADGVVSAGRTLRVLGGIVLALAIIIAVGGFALTAEMFQEYSVVGAIVVFFIGIIWGNSIMARGLLMMAQGQATMAMLDNAVYNSSFLENNHRTRVLGLPAA